MEPLPLDPLSPIAAPRRGAEEIRTNATYEVLMWALARPGTIRTLPEPGMEAIAETLIDRECRVFSQNAALLPAIAATGATLGPAETADHAFLSLDGAAGLSALSVVPAGSHAYTDEGATVFAAARLGEGRRLRLSGPGIETTVDVTVGGLPDEVWAIRAARCVYPTGFELFLIDGDRVLGLPRSATVEVL
jgi:alpha-D-ribose 1-methylphosphonate 5-triphosphate synthase subunit PhnH